MKKGLRIREEKVVNYSFMIAFLCPLLTGILSSILNVSTEETPIWAMPFMFIFMIAFFVFFIKFMAFQYKIGVSMGMIVLYTLLFPLFVFPIYFYQLIANKTYEPRK
jgi:hypothetical protein